MRHRIPTCIASFSLLAALLAVSDSGIATAQGPGRAGGARPGGAGGARPGGGAARPMPNRSPAMSRPANVSRPGGGNVPRPGGGNVPRPGGGNLPNPGGAAARPGGGNLPRPGGGNLPNPGGAAARPGGGFQRPSTLPGQNAGANRPNLPGTGGAGRPTTLPGNVAGKDRPNVPGNLPGGAGRPTTLPGNLPGGAGRPTTLPGNVAGAGNRPNLPNRPGGGPTSGQLNDFLGGGGPATRPVNRFPNAGNNSTNIAQNQRPVVVNNSGNVNIGNRNTLNYASNKQAWVDNRHATGNVVRNNAGNRYWNAYNGGVYRNTWGGNFGGYNYNRGWAAGYAWGTFNALTFRTFIGPTFFPVAPVYFAYGTGGNVYYENNTVYVNDQPAGTPEQYYQQAQTLVAAAPETTPEQDEWMPLGVFALAREDVEDSQMTIELAVDKQGVVAGTYYNDATGVSRPLKGTMDAKTQRTAIGFADGRNAEIVLETGVANLTEDEAPALLHKGKDVSDPVMLVRLKKPEGAK